MNRGTSKLFHGLFGACGGAAAIFSSTSPCSAADCSTCFRCLGMATILAALALYHRGRKMKVLPCHVVEKPERVSPDQAAQLSTQRTINKSLDLKSEAGVKSI